MFKAYIIIGIIYSICIWFDKETREAFVSNFNFTKTKLGTEGAIVCTSIGQIIGVILWPIGVGIRIVDAISSN